jgi:hypothetical protein
MVAEPSSVGDEFQNLAFGPSIERVIEFNNSERRALILGSGNFVTLAPGTDFGPGPGGVEAARGAGADLYFPPQEADAAARLTALDWRLLHDLPSRPVQAEAAALESVTPEAVRGQLEYWTRQRGEPDGAEAGLAELLARVPARKSQNHTEDFSDSNVKLFVTRDGTAGVLQIAGASEDPAGMKIRYKLIEAPRGLSRANLVKERKRARDDFTARLEAAMTIFGINEKDDALGQVARDAAKAGEPEIVRKAIGNMIGNNSRDATAHEAALLLAKAGQRKAAVEIAKSIFGNTTRDQTLSELAK